MSIDLPDAETCHDPASRSSLREFVRKVRVKFCSHMGAHIVGGDNERHRCDCKFGNGCPEMRMIYRLLSNMTDAEFERILLDKSEYQGTEDGRRDADRFVTEIRSALVLAGGREFTNEELNDMTLREVSVLLGTNLDYVGLKIRS